MRVILCTIGRHPIHYISKQLLIPIKQGQMLTSCSDCNAQSVISKVHRTSLLMSNKSYLCAFTWTDMKLTMLWITWISRWGTGAEAASQPSCQALKGRLLKVLWRSRSKRVEARFQFYLCLWLSCYYLISRSEETTS